MTALGGVDVLRVLAGQRSAQDDFASLTEQERAYLIRQFTDQGDWDRLWRFTLLMPLAEAVEAVRGCGDWRPSGEDERRVFEALRAADPQAVVGCVNALSGVPASSPAPHIRIRLADLDKRLGGVSDLDFAPDGTQLAMVGAVSAGDRAFVVSAVVDDTDTYEHPVLFIGGPGGSLVASGILDGLDDLDDFEPLIAAVDPDRRLVTMVDDLQDGVVADLRSSVVNKLDDGSGTLENVPMLPAALSPSTLVSCAEAGDLKVWHEPLTSTEPSMTIPAWSAATRPTALAWSSVLNRFLAVDVIQGPHLELLDVPPTRDAPVPDELVSGRMALASNARPAPIVRLSPKGDVLAVGKGGHGTVDLYDLTALTLRPFIARPMGLMTHQELAHVVAVLETPALDEASRTALTLLRACLEHRFRHDVGIGDAAGAAVAGDHEIELGEVQGAMVLSAEDGQPDITHQGDA